MKLSWRNDNFTSLILDSENGTASKSIIIPIETVETQLHTELVKFETVGNPSDNILILGDNLPAMKVLLEQKRNEKNLNIKLIYIDPPYNTGLNIRNYLDKREHEEWLSMIKPRLNFMRELLSEDGFIIVQLDDNEYAALDVLMSEIFLEKNRIGTIIWRRRQSQANLSKGLSTIHDYILIYAKNKQKIPSMKRFDPLWIDTKKFGNNQIATKEIEKYFGDRTLFDTPKPESLLTHLIETFTIPGDTVMDCFSGSGTTIAVAQKLSRKWIGIEASQTNIQLSKKRIQKIMAETLLKNNGFIFYHCKYNLIGENTIQNNISIKNNRTNDFTPISFIWEETKDKCEFYQGKGSMMNNKNLDGIIIDKNRSDASKHRGILIKFTGSFHDFFHNWENIKKEIAEINIKTVILSPAIEIQKLQKQNSSINQYLTFCKEILQKIKKIMNEDSFILFHSIEPNYSKIKLIMDEIFGQKNHVGTIIWKKYYDSNSTSITDIFDMIPIFCKNINEMKFYKLEPQREMYANSDSDPRGPWVSMPLIASEKSTNPSFTYTFKNGITLTRKFRYPEYSIRKLEEENRIHFTKPKNGHGIPRVKKFLYERLDKFETTGAHGYTPNTICADKEQFGSLDDILKIEEKINQPLPYRIQKLYEFLCKITTAVGDSILDLSPESGDISQIITQMKRNIIEIEENSGTNY